MQDNTSQTRLTSFRLNMQKELNDMLYNMYIPLLYNTVIYQE